MIKILAIGNSFSQDATAYLYDIAKADGIELKVVNLYIGGCALNQHWENIETDSANYDYELNGRQTGRKISIKEALQEEAWNYVTLQQVSSNSGLIDTYYPYIQKVSDYVKEYAPQAEQIIHETWAYEMDTDHDAFAHYNKDQLEMYRALKECYEKVAKELSFRLIPCGDVIQSLRTYEVFDYAKGGESLCRDGYHMTLVYGRYATAATWFEFILGGNIIVNSFHPPSIEDVIPEVEVLKLIKNCVHDIVNKTKK